jgi:biotin carboxylase
MKKLLIANRGEIAIRVTLLTLQLGVSARKWEPDRIVIETRRLPCSS